MHPRLALLFSLWLTVACLGGVKAPAGRPTASAADIVKSLQPATLAVVTFHDDTEVVITDKAWLDQLKRTLADASYQPDAYCFCVNYPQITLMAGDQLLTTLQVPHGEKFRFSGKQFSGDFRVGSTAAKAVIDLAMSQRAKAGPASHAVPKKQPPPTKVELKP